LAQYKPKTRRNLENLKKYQFKLEQASIWPVLTDAGLNAHGIQAL
jgi:hypothetical protein